MKGILLVPYYLRWHYGRALASATGIISNFIWFLWHFFSVKILSKTLFSPWERLQEKREKGLDVEGFLATLIINTVMRLVGAIVRLTFILIGLVSIFIAFICGIIFMILWLALPAVIMFSIALGIILLAKTT